MIARVWHGVIAVAVCVAMVLQIVIAVRVSGTPHEVTTGVLRGSSLAGRIIRVLSFFTIQSNLLSGAVSAQLALRPGRDGPAWRALRLTALTGITVTGIVYSTVLAAIHQPNGTAETVVNLIVHYIVPVMMIVGWLLFGPRPRIDRRTVAWSLLFPVLWLAYTLVRGAIWEWYPYPFLDVATHGYGRVAGNALLVTVVLGLVAALFATGDRFLPSAQAAQP
ncbi:MAG TPA: Pr6Pr family membrane protein [Streptosporangiaceae bacterium]|nr:Pr6Pr family membrane protein [Streptosporangiaceae bacterium]